VHGNPLGLDDAIAGVLEPCAIEDDVAPDPRPAQLDPAPDRGRPEKEVAARIEPVGGQSREVRAIEGQCVDDRGKEDGRRLEQTVQKPDVARHAAAFQVERPNDPGSAQPDALLVQRRSTRSAEEQIPDELRPDPPRVVSGLRQAALAQTVELAAAKPVDQR
jgi:hypothetical protein